MSTAIMPLVRKAETIADELDELENAAQYRLSDAIRDGVRFSDQAYGSWYSDDGSHLCALSTAYVALKARHMIA